METKQIVFIVTICVLIISTLVFGTLFFTKKTECPVQGMIPTECPDCPPTPDCPSAPDCPAAPDCPPCGDSEGRSFGGGFGGGGFGGGGSRGRNAEAEPSGPNQVKLEIKTYDGLFAGTDNSVQITLGNGKTYTLNVSGRNDFERGNTDTFYLNDTSITESDLKKSFVLKIIPGSMGTNDWMFENIKMYFNRNLVRSEGVRKWLSRDVPQYFFEACPSTGCSM